MEIINPFKDQNIEIIDLPVAEDSRFGSSLLNSAKELQIGSGGKVFRGDQSGIWLGGETFNTAPFRVNMDGDVVANSLTLSGYIPTGGALSDIGAGNITGTYISSGAITTPKIAANAITSDKISVSQLSAISANIGDITAGTITGLTITGGTIQTSSSGLRTVLDSSTDTIRFMNGSTTYAYIEPYAGGSNLGVRVVSYDVELGLNDGLSTAWLTVNGLGLDIDSGGHTNFDRFIRLAQLSGATATGLTPINGSMYYRTDDNVIRVYLNGTWRTITTA